VSINTLIHPAIFLGHTSEMQSLIDSEDLLLEGTKVESDNLFDSFYKDTASDIAPRQPTSAAAPPVSLKRPRQEHCPVITFKQPDLPTFREDITKGCKPGTKPMISSTAESASLSPVSVKFVHTTPPATEPERVSSPPATEPEERVPPPPRQEASSEDAPTGASSCEKKQVGFGKAEAITPSKTPPHPAGAGTKPPPPAGGTEKKNTHDSVSVTRRMKRAQAAQKSRDYAKASITMLRDRVTELEAKLEYARASGFEV
jgi:hypothetical protein